MSIVTKTPVLVSGATGFISLHVIQQLLQKGYQGMNSSANQNS
jgi:nucleoside-diphosphate-sugar epimerase